MPRTPHLPCMPPAMHAPLPCMSPCHAHLLPCTPPAMHAPYYICPPAMHGPLPCTPLCHAHTPLPRMPPPCTPPALPCTHPPHFVAGGKNSFSACLGSHCYILIRVHFRPAHIKEYPFIYIPGVAQYIINHVLTNPRGKHEYTCMCGVMEYRATDHIDKPNKTNETVS